MKNAIFLFVAWLCFTSQLLSQECQPTGGCESAVLICGYAMEHNVFNNDVQPGSPTDVCNIAPHNTVWFQVIPCDSVIELIVQPLSTQNGDGLQVALLESCDALTAIACNPGQDMGAGMPLPIIANVTPGQSYWLMIDGYLGDVCDFTIDILQGIDTNMPVPSSGGPFPGAITGQSFGICQTSAGVYTATWPGCSNWTGGGFVCKDDDCTCINWTLPPGAVILGDPCSPSVTIDFSGTPPGSYLLVATPECLCDENLCESCGPICCPVTPAELPISINGVPLITLPDIWVCTFEDFPNCVFEPGNFFNSTSATCFTPDPVNCQILRQNYRIRPPIVENLGLLPLCDTVWVCNVPYTTFGQHVEFCISPDGCDSTVIFTLVPDPACQYHCTGLNIPAAPGDSCHLAPFFCGNHLESYCGSNAGLQDDTIGNQVLENAGFIRFSTCEDSIAFRLAVRNCNPGGVGLNFEVFTGACLSGASAGSTSVNNLEFFTWGIGQLSPDSVYTLVVSGINGSECDFTLETLTGIGTGLPPADSCVCTEGYIEGPDQICPGDVYQFSIVWPSCTVLPGTSTGGNGEFCLPAGICPANEADSLVWKWHIPPGTQFVGDSTGASILVTLDSSYFDLDTIRIDSVYLTWSFVNPNPTQVDSLLFCDCNATACFGVIAPKQVTILHNVDFYSCILTCFQPSCSVDGIDYFAAGNYVRDVDNCNRQIIVVLEDFALPAPPFVSNQTICVGGSATLAVLNSQPFYQYNWSSGDFGETITVSPSVTTTYTITVTSLNSGCTSTGEVTVTVSPEILPTQLPPAILCPGESITVCGNEYSTPGDYSITCTSVLGCDSLVNFSILNGLGNAGFNINIDQNPVCTSETVTMQCVPFGSGVNLEFTWTNLSSGETYSGASVSLALQNSATFEVQGLDIQSGCVIFQNIDVLVNPFVEQQLGLVGSISCNEPCFTFNGKTYCQTGQYRDTSSCEIAVFDIGFYKDTLQQGAIGTLTCLDTCVMHLGQSYCAPGTYSLEDDCFVYHFEVGENLLQPEVADLLHTCLPNNTQFTVSFNLSGQQPFKVNDVPLSGSHYLSAPIANNSNYLFVVKQNNGCKTIVSGLYDCSASCVSDAGQLSAEIIRVCGSQESAAAQSMTDPVLAPGDVVSYWLQSSDGALIEQSATGIFTFNPTTQTAGTEYKIVRVVGPAGADGQPDVNHPCTQFSGGQPLVFQSVPQIDSILTGSPKCAGDADGWLEIFGSDPASGNLEYALNGIGFGPTAYLNALEAGVYEVIVRNDAGCLTTTSITIPDAVDINLEIGPDQIINFGESALLVAVTSTPPANISWTSSNGWSASDTAQWRVRPLENIVVYCEVIDSNGCKDADETLILVKLETNIYRPNVIHPNAAQGENRYFTLYAAEGWISRIHQLSIYNRWGEMVWQKQHFDANIPEAGWDGMYQGRFCLPGVYIYRAEVELADGSRTVFEGDVTLVR